MFRWSMFHGNQGHSQTSRPRNAFVPSCRSSQERGLCPQTLLVRSRLGGGATTRHWGTAHQADEQERRSHQPPGLRALGAAVPHTVGAVYIRTEHQVSSTRRRPVRRPAPSLPSAVTQQQTAGGQTAVPACACTTRPAPACARAPSRLELCRVGVRGSCNTLSPLGAAVRRGGRLPQRPRGDGGCQAFSLRCRAVCRWSLWRTSPRDNTTQSLAPGETA